MDIITALVLGFAAGVLAILAIYRTLPKEPMTLIGAGVIGVVGGLLGHWIAGLLGIEAVNWLGALVIGFLGAAGILMLLQRFNPRGSSA